MSVVRVKCSVADILFFLPLQRELPSKKDCPHMCAYKLVTVKFKWWGLQNKVENFIQKVGKASCSPLTTPGARTRRPTGAVASVSEN